MEVTYIFFLILSWVNNFGYEGLGVLLDVLEKLLDKKQ
jgi:diaphanous 2